MAFFDTYIEFAHSSGYDLFSKSLCRISTELCTNFACYFKTWMKIHQSIFFEIIKSSFALDPVTEKKI